MFIVRRRFRASEDDSTGHPRLCMVSRSRGNPSVCVCVCVLLSGNVVDEFALVPS